MTAFATPRPLSGKIVSGTNNIPTAFDATAGSKVITGLGALGYRRLMVINETAGRLAMVTQPPGDGIPSSTIVNRFYIPANSVATFDEISILGDVYVQSDTGSALSSGTVTVNVW